MFGAKTTFIANLVGVKIDAATSLAIKAYVSWDPKGASEADLRSREQQLIKLGMSLAAARSSHARLGTKLDEQKAAIGKDIHVIENLQSKLAAATDANSKASFQQSIDTLMNSTEEKSATFDQAKAEYDAASKELGELEEAHATGAKKVKDAVHALTMAQSSLTAAQRSEAREAEHAKNASVAAGLRQESSNLDIALNAMREATQDANNRAEGHRITAEALNTRPAVDANIKAAMDEVEAANKPAPASLNDRLEALKRKAA